MSEIDYSQCWEDALVLREALNVHKGDAVLSIASGGDNSLALLPAHPGTLVLVDKSAAQIHLCELKLKAPLALTHGEYLEFLGAAPTTSANRLMHLEKVLPFLSPEGREWILPHRQLVERGLVHCGRFERYLAAFRRYLLPLVHNGDRISSFLAFDTLEAQRAFFDEQWNTWRWRLFLRLAGSRTLLRRFARQPGQDRGCDPDRDTDYGARLERLIARVPLQDNPYVHYCFTGEYGPRLPEYLTEETFAQLSQDAARTDVKLVAEDLQGHLKSVPDESYEKFNLSDVFESFAPDENDAIWHQVLRVATDGARVVHWCNQVDRQPPASLERHLVPDIGSQTDLSGKDRLFFYRSFNVRVVRK